MAKITSCSPICILPFSFINESSPPFTFKPGIGSTQNKSTCPTSGQWNVSSGVCNACEMSLKQAGVPASFHLIFPDGQGTDMIAGAAAFISGHEVSFRLLATHKRSKKRRNLGPDTLDGVPPDFCRRDKLNFDVS